MSCTKNELNCLNTVLDCGKNQVSIGNACYSVNQVKDTNTNIVRFNSLNTPSQTYLKKDGVHNLANFENTPILKCFQKCSQDENCDAIQFNFGNINDPNLDELNENGYCQLFSFKAGENGTTNTKDDSTIPVNPKYTKLSVYQKDVGSPFKASKYPVADPNGNFTVSNKDQVLSDPKSLQFTKTNDNPNKITKLFSKYQGGICRNDLNETSCNLMSPYVSRWCQQNPDSETCKKFCEYSDCPSRTITPLIVYGALTLVSLVLIILAFGKTNNIYLKSISIGIFIAMGVLLTIQIIRFTQPIYNGSEPNVVPDWYSTSACESGKYKNVLGNCI